MCTRDSFRHTYTVCTRTYVVDCSVMGGLWSGWCSRAVVKYVQRYVVDRGVLGGFWNGWCSEIVINL